MQEEDCMLLIVEEERVELFNPLLRIRREIMQRRKEEV